MGPEALAQVLRPLIERFPPDRHPELLVGLDDPDDAAVYQWGDGDALVATTDFFPPVVDDPYDFGAIAAANAMSDVFAMGGEVVLALNLASFPDALGTAAAALIITGGADKVAEAGAVLAGGHTIAGDEPMYGLAVIGRVAAERMLRKSGARPGDVLVLTKALGTGVVTTAIKAGRAGESDVAAATASMSALNLWAARTAVAAGVRAATDVTGFGLLGHAAEMAGRSGVAVRIDVDALPLLPGAAAYAEAGHVPGGTKRVRAGFGERARGLDELPGPMSDLVCDPQTSGGLLVAVDPARARAYLDALASHEVQGAVVGRVEPGAGVDLRRVPREV